jgi:type I restriction enzyme S subunit
LTGQASIVAEIEKQFSRLDEAVANLKRVKTNLKRYTAAVLNAAVDGRLVLTEAELARREGRAFETAAEQLARFRGARTDGRHGRVSGEAWGKEATQDLPLLSTGWCWSNFEAVADRVTVGHVGPMKDEYVAEGIPFLRSQNVRPNRYDPEGLKFISPDFHSKLQKSALEPGDILVVRSGSVGVACVVPVSLPVANCSDLVIIKRPRGVLPGYGAFYLNAVVDSRIAAGRVGIALAHFNTKSVANLPVPVPPLAEQARIVAEVDRRLSIVREIDAEAEANLQRAQRFRQATLQAVLGRGL